MLIRRKLPVAVTSNVKESVAVSDEGFEPGNSLDFLTNEAVTDFVTDNEVMVTEEMYKKFVEEFGAVSAHLDEQMKSTAESLARLDDKLGAL